MINLPNILQFNGTDYAILGVIGCSGLISLMRGLIREAIALITWIMSVWLATQFSSSVAVLLTPYIKTTAVSNSVAFGILVILTLIAGTLLNRFLGRLAANIGLGGIDHTLGLLFGLLRGVMLVGVLLLLASAIHADQEQWWQGSLLIPYFHDFTAWLKDLLPNHWQQITA